MSSHTTTFTASGTFTAPATLLTGTVMVDVRGAQGGTSSNGAAGGLGGRVTASIPVTPSGTLSIYVAVGKVGFSGGGGGRFVNGGGSSGIKKSSTVEVEAGGGGGGGTPVNGGSGGGGGHAGAAGTFASTHGGGGGGGNGGSGGSAYLGTAGGAGAGGGTNGSAGTSSAAGAGGGSGGVAGGGTGAEGGPGSFPGAAGGTSYCSPSIYISATFYAAWNAGNGAVLVTYQTADPDLSPTLLAPTNGSYVDMSAAGSITFKRNPGAQSGALTGWAVRRKTTGGSYTYFKASTGTWTSSIVYNAPTLLTSLGTNEFKYSFASAKWTDGNTYQWSAATQNTLTGHVLTSTFPTDVTVIATAMPTVTFTAPTATVTTGTPAVTWTHTLGGGDSQTKYRVIVYTKAQTLSTTFNPGSTAGVWDSGLVSSAATSVTVGTVLTNTTTYVVYVQITETGTVVSSWTSKAFKVAFTPPATPSFTATPSIGANGHPQVALNVTGTGANLTSAQLQRSTNGTTWTTLPTGTDVPLLADSGTFTDYRAPLGVTLSYRARVKGTVTSQVVASTWSTVRTVTLPNTKFWIGNPLTPSSFIPLARGKTSSSSMSGAGTASITIQQTEVQGQFRAFGRSTYIVVHGTLMAEEFTLTLNFLTTAQYQAFLALRAQKLVLLVQSDMPGEQYYITLGPTRPMSIMRAATRKVTPIRQLTMHCFPATAPT